MAGLLDVTVHAEAQTRRVRAYRGQPARDETTYTLSLTTARVEAARTAGPAGLAGASRCDRRAVGPDGGDGWGGCQSPGN